MGKKDGSTSACYLWRFTEVWEMLMWLTFIYNMFRNGPRVHVLPLRLSFRTHSSGGNEKKWYQICFAVQEHKIFYLFIFPGGGGSSGGGGGGGGCFCHISGGFLPPHRPLPSLNISLYVCLSLDEGAASTAPLLSYRSVSLENVNCSTD